MAPPLALLFDHARNLGRPHSINLPDLAANFRGEAIRLLLFIEVNFDFKIKIDPGHFSILRYDKDNSR